MPRNQKKDYAIRGPGNEPVSIADYRKAPWRQCYFKNTYDFRRWLYTGRPELDDQGHGVPDEQGLPKALMHAVRDGMVEAIRDAVWYMPSKGEVTKNAYCKCGVATWFEYLDCREASGQPVYELTEITQEVIRGYISWLRNTKESDTDTSRLSYNTAKTLYHQTKAVLKYLANQSVLPEGLFPRNPFPNHRHAVIGHKPYPKKMMTLLMGSLYKDIQGLRDGTLKISATQALTVYLLVIAARTGRNPTPLVELTRDAVKEHPIKPDRLGLLVTYKRRGHKTSVQAFAAAPKLVEDMVSMPMDALTLYREVVALTEPLVAEMPLGLRNRLWLYRQTGSGRGVKDHMDVLTNHKYFMAAQSVIKRHELQDEYGKPLQLNISRLRKTFAQRMWQLTGGDIVAVSEQLGNTPAVAGQTYVAVTPEMEANFRRLGHIMHADWSGKLDDVAFLAELSRETGIPAEQLKSIAVGDNNTGVGRCSDPLRGEKAPGDGTYCTRWVECFHCHNQIVMESDLYRLFSFYYLLLKERNFISRLRWDELYGKIIHIIDHEIIVPNLRTKENPKGCFDPYRVQKYRAEAEVNPHPMWQDRTILGSVQ
ncbi:MAG: integrase [Syntrophobacteraceae bacterium]|jgi:hypothetical protein